MHQQYIIQYDPKIKVWMDNSIFIYLNVHLTRNTKKLCQFSLNPHYSPPKALFGHCAVYACDVKSFRGYNIRIFLPVNGYSVRASMKYEKK